MVERKKTKVKTWDSGNHTYSLDDASKIRHAATIIAKYFSWDDTTEGPEFWIGVHSRLHDIANNIERRVKAGDKL